MNGNTFRVDAFAGSISKGLSTQTITKQTHQTEGSPPDTHQASEMFPVFSCRILPRQKLVSGKPFPVPIHPSQFTGKGGTCSIQSNKIVLGTGESLGMIRSVFPAKHTMETIGIP
jgi:hypothetical protein